MHDVSVVDLILAGKKEPNWYTNEGKLEWEDLEERATPLHSPATAYVWNVPQPQPMRLRHLQEILEKRQSSSFPWILLCLHGMPVLLQPNWTTRKQSYYAAHGNTTGGEPGSAPVPDVITAIPEPLGFIM